ncbi:MAG: polyprenyl synthetase family protein [Bacteroidales bacterium]|nr:polyprenyl synthetase family protein [Bacteroidales bacterium]
MAKYSFPDIIQEDMQQLNKMFGSQLLSKTTLLNAVTSYVFGNTGKQLRPALVFLTARILGGVTESTYSAAYMVELLHNATLVHDDVVDDSEKRRGLASVKAIWKNKIAVLVGDYYLAKGLLFAIEHNEIKFLEIISNAVREMSEGELKQIDYAKSLKNNEQAYYDIISCKTAALFRAAMVMGAHSSKQATEDDIQKIAKIAEYLGIAFQIRDDVLDYSKSEVLGKAPLNDLQEKKMTLPLIYALQQASIIERGKIFLLLKTHNNKKKTLQKIADFVEEKGGLTFVTGKNHEFCDLASDLCNSFPDSECRTALLDLIKFVRL